MGLYTLALVPLLFAAFSSGSTYQLQSYGLGPGATNSSSSTTYSLQGSAGEQANGTASSTNDTANNGSIQTEQLNIPGAPTLSNGSGTYYNKLNCVIAPGSDPTDTQFAMAVSTNNFATTLGYVQANGTIGASQVYQTYTTWGGAGGQLILNLSPSTTYEVAVAAMQGKFTNTNFGAYATAATVGLTMTFSVSPNSLSLGSLLPGTVSTSSSLTLSFATDAANGGSVYDYGTNNGLLSANTSHTIPAFTGNLVGHAEGFGIQASGATQSSGGPLSIASPYNGTGNVVGSESTVPAQFLTTSGAIVGGSASSTVQAITSSTTPAATDYKETLTFIAAGSF
jgi:hypothetical protein